MGDQGTAGAVVSFTRHYFLMLILEFFFFGGGGNLWFIFLLIYIFSDPFDCITPYFYQGDLGPAGRDGLDGAAGLPVSILYTLNNDHPQVA